MENFNEEMTRKLVGYASLTNDYMFKRVFGSEECKDILIAFLNDILGGPEIVDIDILNSENLGHSQDDRKAVFDIFCRSSDSEEFIVEMQCAPQEYFRDRALFYTSFPIARQAALAKKRYLDEHGNSIGFKWNYKLKPVKFIGITDFAISHIAEWPTDKYISHYELREETCNELLTANLNFIFLELARFKKSEEELTSITDKWMYLLCNMPKLRDRPSAFTEKSFERLFEVAEFANFAAEQLELYRNAEKMKYDYQNTIDYAEKKGIEKGRAEGFANGMEKGREEGKVSVAQNLLRMGMSLEDVAAATGLPVETLINLQL